MHSRLSIWAPLPPDVYLRRPRERLPFPLEEPGCRIVAWARHAIYHGVGRLGLGPGDNVLVSAWHHGSEVEALRQAGVGVRFFDPGEDLDPRPEDLEPLLDDSVRALHLTHALGFPADAPRWRRWCDEHGLLLIEDAAQAWLAACDDGPVGSFGDLAVFCLYKTFGLPEGAALVQRDPPPAVGLDPRLGAVELARRHGMWLAGRSGLVYAASAPLRRPKPYDPAEDFALRDPAAGPWRHTPFVLRRVVDEGAAERRRANYRTLLGAVGPHVPPAFAELPGGASPFVCPVAVADKPALLARLRERGVGTLDLWSVPHPSLPVDDFPQARGRRETWVGLPVHQELRPRDLDRIAAATLEAL